MFQADSEVGFRVKHSFFTVLKPDWRQLGLGGLPLPHDVCLKLRLSWAQVWGWHRAQAGWHAAVAMVTLLLSFQRRMDFSFSPDHLPGLPPFCTLRATDCPAPLPSAFCRLLRGSVFNHSPVSETACSGLKGKQEMRQLTADMCAEELPLCLLLPSPPPPSRRLPLQSVALTFWVGSDPCRPVSSFVTGTARAPGGLHTWLVSELPREVLTGSRALP